MSTFQSFLFCNPNKDRRTQRRKERNKQRRNKERNNKVRGEERKTGKE
jgi:hypothetical protein